jgi:hypothetical protein
MHAAIKVAMLLSLGELDVMASASEGQRPVLIRLKRKRGLDSFEAIGA